MKIIFSNKFISQQFITTVLINFCISFGSRILIKGETRVFDEKELTID